MKKLFLILILPIITISLLSSSITLAIYENPPHTFIDSKDKPQGFIVDIIRDFCSKYRFELNFKRISFSEGLKQLEKDEIDLIAPIAFTADRAEKFNYCKESLIIDWSVVISLETTYLKTIKDLNGKKLGILEADAPADRFIEELRQEQVKTEVIKMKTLEEILIGLKKRIIDAGFYSKFSLSYLLKEIPDLPEVNLMPATFYQQSLYFGVTKQRPELLDLLDTYLHSQKKDPQSNYYISLSKWFGEELKGEKLQLKKLLPIFFILISIILFFLLISVYLRQQVKKRIAEIKEQKIFFENLFQSMPAAIVILDNQNRVVHINPEFKKVFGYEDSEITGMDIDQLIQTEETLAEGKRFTAETIAGRRINVESRRKRKDGQLIDVQIIGAPIIIDGVLKGVIGIYIDISEKKKLLEESIKHKNLESIGILAAGIAHDFNNMLTGITGNLSLIKMQLTDRKFQQLIEKAESATEKASSLARQLLAFSKGGISQKKVFNLTNIIRESLSFILSGSPIKYQLEIEASKVNVEGDPSQIAQVFNNIILNAKQAMPGGGTIIVRVFNEMVKDQPAPSSESEFIVTTITDSGPGIPEENLKKIFLPYFTTKPTGTGLGLATAFSIIKKHSGKIEVKSILQHGATFSVYLPVSEKLEKLEQENQIELKAARKIFIMDDEPIIRELFNSLQKEEPKLSITITENSEQALSAYQESINQGKKFDLIFLDLTIPGDIGGIETLKKILQIDPDVCAVAISGYSDSEIFTDPQKFGFKAVLPKPFSISALFQIINLHSPDN